MSIEPTTSLIFEAIAFFESQASHLSCSMPGPLRDPGIHCGPSLCGPCGRASGTRGEKVVCSEFCPSDLLSSTLRAAQSTYLEEIDNVLLMSFEIHFATEELGA